MIVNITLEIDIDDFIIAEKRYEGTRGLYELLFMNIPNLYVYSEQYFGSYAMILKDTNAHKINYLPKGKVKSNIGNKYKNIISLIASRESVLTNKRSTYSDLGKQIVSGSGLILTDVNPNFSYQDDLNVLVDRLRILTASQDMGLTGHVNDINSVIDELKELDEKSVRFPGKSILD